MNPRLRAVARTSVRTLNSPVARARLTRALAKAPRPLRLEIGGVVQRPGWVVTNVNAVTKLYLDATSTWPLEDGSVEYVFSDNVIEHITLDQGRAMLAEAARCMIPGGVIRLVTPDIRTHVELYLSGKDPMDSPAGKHYHGMGLTVEHPIDLVRIPIGSFGHHVGYVYDFDTLAAELVKAGFHSPVRRELGESDHEPLRGIDTRNTEGGVQLVVEATR